MDLNVEPIPGKPAKDVCPQRARAAWPSHTHELAELGNDSRLAYFVQIAGSGPGEGAFGSLIDNWPESSRLDRQERSQRACAGKLAGKGGSPLPSWQGEGPRDDVAGALHC